jgi:hypothetical protein
MRTLKVAVVVIALLLVAAVRTSTPGQVPFSDIPVEWIIQGLGIAPVSLNINGKDLRLVGLGSYLVNAAGGCNDCHTNPPYAPGGDPFAGQPLRINTTNYLAGGQKFGPFTSRNLTPDAKSGKPADLDFNQFLEVFRRGTDFKKLHPPISPLLQVMPWPVYGKLTDTSLFAIYTYLSAIPHVDSPPAN